MADPSLRRSAAIQATSSAVGPALGGRTPMGEGTGSISATLAVEVSEATFIVRRAGTACASRRSGRSNLASGVPLPRSRRERPLSYPVRNRSAPARTERDLDNRTRGPPAASPHRGGAGGRRPACGRTRRARPPRRARRRPLRREPRGHPRAGRPDVRRAADAARRSRRRPSPTTAATTSSSSRAASRSTRCASTTCCRSSASPTSATCRASGSSGSPSSPGSSSRSPARCRSRSG